MLCTGSWYYYRLALMDSAAFAVEELMLQEEASYNEFISTLHLTAPMSSGTLAEDVESLKRLILEKEKDLELAARIGQSLLTKNRLLQINHDELAQLFTVTQDELTQLRHELSMNKEILRIYSLESSDYGRDDLDHDPAVVSFKHVQMLQARIRFLEDENNRLRQEAKELSVEAADFETKETEIIHDCVKELAETHGKIQMLTESLKTKSDENLAFRDEIELLLNEMVELQTRVKKAGHENDEIKESINVYKENQSQLATELIKLQDKYDLISSHAHSLEEELRAVRRKDTYIQSWAEVTASFSQMDSLAAELDHSLYHVYNSVESAEDDQDDQYRRIIDIVRQVNMPRSQADTVSTTVNPSTACITSAASSAAKSTARKMSPARLGQPEIPDATLGSYFGSHDLSRTDFSSGTSNDDGICDRTFLGTLSCDSRNCATPDSALGAGSDSASYHHQGNSFADVSSKLLLVKQMEGSQMLSRWKHLAEAQMNGFLEERPGIYTKGQNPVSDQIVAEKVAARKENAVPADVHLASFTGPTLPKISFTSAKIGHSAGSSSIFSTNALKLGRPSGALPVFTRPVQREPSPGLNLAQVLHGTVTSSPSYCDPLNDLPDEEDAEPEPSRRRRTSGSLSSASRSPSPVKSDLLLAPDRTSTGIFQPLQKLYHYGQSSPLVTPRHSLEMLGKKSLKGSGCLAGKLV